MSSELDRERYSSLRQSEEFWASRRPRGGSNVPVVVVGGVAVVAIGGIVLIAFMSLLVAGLTVAALAIMLTGGKNRR